MFSWFGQRRRTPIIQTQEDRFYTGFIVTNPGFGDDRFAYAENRPYQQRIPNDLNNILPRIQAAPPPAPAPPPPPPIEPLGPVPLQPRPPRPPPPPPNPDRPIS